MREAYRRRKVHQPPEFFNFKPSGIPRKLLKKVTISVDEFEAIRLADYKGLEHLQASEEMAISRPTFSRLIEKARNKIAQAIIEGKELIIEGGNIEFKNMRHRCRDCGDDQLRPTNDELENCPECGSENYENSVRNFKQ